jgi:calcium-dependent protein kinase
MDTVGSPYYMSPEVLFGKYGKECDVWSLGVVIFQMLTGDYPFDGDTVAEINEKIRKGSFNVPDSVSNQGYDLLNKMIDYRNDERATFAQLLKHPWFTKPKESPVDQSVVERLKKYKSDSFLKHTVMSLLVKQLSTAETKNLKE